MDKETRAKWWQAKICLRGAPPARNFFTLSTPLSPPTAYKRIDGDLPGLVIGAGRERAVIAPVEPGDTLHLHFHGVGQAGDAAAARLWGLEPRGVGYDGRHLADFVLRLGGDELEAGGFCRRPPARMVTTFETPFEAAPFPGIISRWKPTSGNMIELMMGVWDYTAYIVEITMQVPDGARPMEACAALWAAYPHPKPPTDEQLRQHHEDFMQQMRDSGVEFHTPDDEDDKNPR
jgi:hypothetical protein